MRGETETLAPAHRGGSKPYPGEELPLLIDASVYYIITAKQFDNNKVGKSLFCKAKKPFARCAIGIRTEAFRPFSCVYRMCVHLRRLPRSMRGEAEALAPVHRGGSEPYPGEELPLRIDASVYYIIG